jgi:hypothetical protein
MTLVALCRIIVGGHPVTWTNDSIVRVSRELCDALPESELLPIRANTPREFEAAIARIQKAYTVRKESQS